MYVNICQFKLPSFRKHESLKTRRVHVSHAFGMQAMYVCIYVLNECMYEGVDAAISLCNIAPMSTSK
jgi:hypothetical protein